MATADKYREAFRGHMAGLAGIVFPFGTYWMRKFAKVLCETAEMVGEVLRAPAMEPAPA
jgi:hypothetical protein